MADPPAASSLPWRIGSTTTMGVVGALARAFMYGLNSVETHGLENFLELLDKRKDVDGRERGLLTVSNHVSVIDDPLIWAPLPFGYHWNPSNSRWSLGSHDICFKNKFSSAFFTLGQTLPTHRLAHSPHGGPFQLTMTEAVRLLSHPPFTTPTQPLSPASSPSPSLSSPDITDPFTSPTHHTYTYTTNGHDTFPAPSAFASRHYSWVHIFPEGRVHQHPHKTMRYFKWGIARLILEPDVCPDIVPMWIEGNSEIMHEARKWPRFVPRVGKTCQVWFGDNVGGEEEGVFHELRERWRSLLEDVRRGQRKSGREGSWAVGVLEDELRYGWEAVELRKECTMAVRREVLKIRRLRGLPDEDPKEGLVETWVQEGGGKNEGEMEDESWVGRT